MVIPRREKAIDQPEKKKGRKFHHTSQKKVATKNILFAEKKVVVFAVGNVPEK